MDGWWSAISFVTALFSVSMVPYDSFFSLALVIRCNSYTKRGREGGRLFVTARVLFLWFPSFLHSVLAFSCVIFHYPFRNVILPHFFSGKSENKGVSSYWCFSRLCAFASLKSFSPPCFNVVILQYLCSVLYVWNCSAARVRG